MSVTLSNLLKYKPAGPGGEINPGSPLSPFKPTNPSRPSLPILLIQIYKRLDIGYLLCNYEILKRST